MKNIKRIWFLVLIVCAFLALFSACSNNGNETQMQQEVFTITYMDGNSELKTSHITNDAKQYINYIPKKEGFVFSDWYLDKNLTKVYTKQTRLEKIVLYARWEKESYTVSFKDFYGVTISSQTIFYKESAEAPTATKIDNYEFISWDKEFSSITSNLTVNAIYKRINSTFSAVCAGQTVFCSSVNAGENLDIYLNSAKDELTIPSGFIFDSWCWDVDLRNKLSLNPIMSENDVTVYAKLVIAPLPKSASTLSSDKIAYTYGESTPSLTHTLNEAFYNSASGIQYSYAWYLDEILISDSSSELILKDLSSGTHVFKSVITASCEGYEPVTLQKEIEISVYKAEIFGVCAQNVTADYDAEAHQISVNGLQPNDEVLYSLDGTTYSNSNPKLINANDYTIYYKVIRANHFDYHGFATVSISKIGLTLTVDDKMARYGETMPQFTFTSEGFIYPDEVSVLKGDATYNCDVQNTKTVGSFSVTLGGLTADNYVVSFVSGVFTIEKAKLFIIADDKTIKYGDLSPVYTVTYDGFASGDDQNILSGRLETTCAYAEKEDAGRYTITAKGLTSDYYEIVYLDGTLTVEKLTACVSPDDTTVIYGTDIPLYSATVTGTLDNETLNYEIFCPYAKGDDVSEYPISVIVGENKNYEVTAEYGTLTVTAKKLTVTADNKTVIYGSLPSYSATFDGFIEGENVSSLGGTLSFTCTYQLDSHIGNYSISPMGLTSENYAIKFVDGNLCVTQKALEISADNLSITYGEDAPVYSATVIGLYGADRANFTLSCDYAKGNDVGQYAVTVIAGTNPNYSVTEVSGTLTVIKKNVIITADDKTAVYGFDAPSFTYTANGLLDGDSISGVTFDTDYVTGNIVGNYTITPSAPETTNYSIQIKNGTLSIIKRKLIFYFDTIKAYDGEVWMKSDWELSLTEGDTFSGTLITVSAENKVYASSGELGSDFVWNNYSLTKSGENVDFCYDVTYDLSVEIKIIDIPHSVINYNGVYDGAEHGAYVDAGDANTVVGYSTDGQSFDSSVPFTYADCGTYTTYYRLTLEGKTTTFGSLTTKITPANVTLIAEDKSITYGDAAPSFTYQENNTVAGESLSNVVVSCPSYTSLSNAGSYVITITESSNPNFAVTCVNGILKVNQKSVTITADDKCATYGDDAPLFTCNYTEFVYVEDETAFVESLSYDCKYVKGSSVGNYPISLSANKNDNYKFSFISAILSVEAKDATLTVNDCTTVYGNAAPAFSIKSSDLIESDNIASISGLTFYTDYEIGSDVGNYDVIITAAENSNYNFSYQKGSLIILARSATVEADNKTITFKDGAPSLTATVNGTFGNDILAYNLYCNYLAGDDAGNYLITVQKGVNDNYDVTVSNGILTVNKLLVAAVWSGINNYVYNGTDLSSNVGATFDGNVASLTFAGEGTVLKTAGNYTVTASYSSQNYTYSNTVKSIVVEKATYPSVASPSFNGTYNPSYTLNENYALPAGYTYVAGSTVPTVNVVSYPAKYNLDSHNYNDYNLNVNISLKKATAVLSGTTVQSFDYDGAVHGISTSSFAVKYGANNISDTYTFCFDNANSFITAGTYRTNVSLDAVNYEFESSYACYVKIKGVKIGSKLYTIEDAINQSVSGDMIILATDTSFADSYNGGCYGASCYIVKTGATLLLPFNDSDTKGYIGEGEAGSENYKNTPVTNGTAVLFRTLTIPQGVNLTVNGTLIVGAVTGKQTAGEHQNKISGNYDKIIANGNINLSNGVLKCYGYITGSGVITANNSTVIENVYLKGWKGGVVSTGRYLGSYDALTVNTNATPKMFPFSQYQMRSIQVTLVINYGSKLQGYCKIATSEIKLGFITLVKAQINEAYMTFVSSGTEDSDGIMQLTAGSSVTKSYYFDAIENKYRTKLLISGHVSDGYTAMDLKVLNKTATMSSQAVLFPIDGLVDVELASGANMTVDYLFKLMPGARLIVNENASLTINGKICAYDSTFVPVYAEDCSNKGVDSLVKVNGTMTVNGSFGGAIISDGSGIIVFASGASTSVDSIEGDATKDGLKFTFTEKNSVTKTASLTNADKTSVAASAGISYSYVNGVWI